MAQGQQDIGRLARATQQQWGLPQGLSFPSPFPFAGMNQQASRLAIGDPEFAWLENLIKIGDGNLRAVPDRGPALYRLGAHDSRKIVSHFGFNLGAINYFIVFLDDGTAVQVEYPNGTQTVITPTAGTKFYQSLGAFPATVQWGSIYLLVANNNSPNDYWAWDGKVVYGAGTLGPQSDLTSSGNNYVGQPTITVLGGHGSGAVLTANIANGSVTGINVINPGTGYLPGDIVQAIFSGGGSDNGAQLTAQLAGTTLNEVIVLAQGTDYFSAPTISFVGGGGSGATATATIDANGHVTGITLTSPGSGYTSAPTVVITPSGPSGSGAVAAATLVPTPLAGISFSDGGTNFIGVPTLTFKGGFGGGAAATAELSGPGPIASVKVTAGGSGFTSLPTVMITDGGPGTGATAVVTTVTGGVIQAISVTNPGSGYTSPSVAITGGGGSGATATAAIGAGSIVSVTLDLPGAGYTDAPAIIVQAGLNAAAQANLQLMPFGVSGTSIETYQSQVWVQDTFQQGPQPTGGVRLSSAPGSISDFATSAGGLSETVTDRFLRRRLTAIRQSNGFLYPAGDSSVAVISNVQVQGNPPTKTLTNQNTDPQTGSLWRDSLQDFSRTILFANRFGVFGLFGGAVTKISGKMDRVFQDALFPDTNYPVPQQPVTPSSAVANLYNRKVYLLLMQIRDPFTGRHRPAMVCWNEQDWSIVSQSGDPLTYISTQEIDSDLAAWGTDGKSLFPLMSAPSKNIEKILSTKLYGAAQPYMTKLARMVYAQCENFADTSRAPLLDVTIDTEFASFPGQIPMLVYPPPGSTLPASALPPPGQMPLLAATAGLDISGQELGLTVRSTDPDFAFYNLMMAIEDAGPIFG
jgi:hypothetical protein